MAAEKIVVKDIVGITYLADCSIAVDLDPGDGKERFLVLQPNAQHRLLEVLLPTSQLTARVFSPAAIEEFESDPELLRLRIRLDQKLSVVLELDADKRALLKALLSGNVAQASTRKQ